MSRLDSTTRGKIRSALSALMPNCEAFLAGSRSSLSKKLPTSSSDIDIFLFGAARHADGRFAYKDDALSSSCSLVANARVEVFCCVEELKPIMTDTMEPLRESGLSHPADVALTKPWFGPEVEGALAKTGMETMFVPCPVPAAELRSFIGQKPECQIFCTEWMLDDDWILSVANPLAKASGCILTVARYAKDRDSIDRLCSAGIALFVRLPDEFAWVGRMPPDAQFSCGTPFNVVSWRVGDGVKTTPDQYAKDKA